MVSTQRGAVRVQILAAGICPEVEGGVDRPFAYVFASNPRETGRLGSFGTCAFYGVAALAQATNMSSMPWLTSSISADKNASPAAAKGSDAPWDARFKSDRKGLCAVDHLRVDVTKPQGRFIGVTPLDLTIDPSPVRLLEHGDT